MKRLRIITLATILLSSAVNAYVGFGVCNFGKQTVTSVICYGPAVLKQTTISGDMKVAGTLAAQNIIVNAITIDGSASLADSTVNGATDVTGALQADHVNFQKDVTIVGDDVSMIHTTVHGSVSISSTNTTPYLKVQCSSAITGTVTFEGKAGVIQITGDSAVQGKITNGSMEFVKQACS